MDHDSEETLSKNGVAGSDELDSNFVAIPEYEADLTGKAIFFYFLQRFI